jgi:hypothetical protein
MKKLFTFILISIFLLEIFCRFTQLPWLFEPAFSQIGSLRTVQYEIDKNNKIEYLFFGNSLTRDAISPKILNDYFKEGLTINAGVSAGSLYLDYKLLSDLNTPPKLIFIQSDIARFSAGVDDNFYFKKLSSFEDWNSLNRKNMNSLINQSKLYASRDLWHRYVFFRDGSEQVGNLLEKDSLGQFDVYGDQRFINEGFFDDEIYNDAWLENINLDSLYYFQKICDYSKLNNIDVVIIHLPLNIGEKSKKSKLINDYLNYLKSTCGPQTRILNYLQIFEKNEDFFMDYGHLNNTGAEVFSKILTEEIGLLLMK